MKELCYTGAQRRFNDRLPNFLEPLMELFSPRSSIRDVPPPKIMVSESITSEVEVDVMVTPPPVSTIASVSGTNPIMDTEDSDSELIPLVLKTL